MGMPNADAIWARDLGIERPLRLCIERIAVRCSLDCCGIDACSLSPVIIKLAADSMGKENTRRVIEQARELALRCEAQRRQLHDFLLELATALEPYATSER